MPLPAVIWSLSSGHGLWYPANLLAGMVLPGVDRMSIAELEQFRLSLLLVAVVIHAVNSVVFGMMYGVLLPTLPHIPRPLAWGGLLIPLLWTAVSFGLMGIVNPLLYKGVDWPWFIASQFVFGVVAALTVMWAGKRHPVLGRAAGRHRRRSADADPRRHLEPVERSWDLVSGQPPGRDGPAQSGSHAVARVDAVSADWLAIAVAIHVAMSIGFGWSSACSYRGSADSQPLTWGGILMPLLWTAVSFGLMGIVNPLLQERVDWPWFIASQFVFGLVAAIVVDRSEKVYIPPAGRGPERRKSSSTDREGISLDRTWR